LYSYVLVKKNSIIHGKYAVHDKFVIYGKPVIFIVI